MHNYPLTLLLRSRTTLLPLDFDHFTPKGLATLIGLVKLRKSCMQMVLPDVLECQKLDHIPSGPWASLGNCFGKCPFVH